jgi:uracil-DNA glycosylase family 4
MEQSGPFDEVLKRCRPFLDPVHWENALRMETAPIFLPVKRPQPKHHLEYPAPLRKLQKQLIACSRCPRLVRWREQVAEEKVRRFQHESYWGRPVPSFGDPQARLLIVGLAPAAHGGNRTGRIFTGDRSGDWLYRALHRAGFANQPTSAEIGDGLELHDCFITAAVHCAPPDNKPTRQEIANCEPFLVSELKELSHVRAIVALGKLGFDSVLAILGRQYSLPPKSKLRFSHGAEFSLTPSLTLLASYHPSQQNTFTGRLTEPMFDAVFARAKTIIMEGS